MTVFLQIFTVVFSLETTVVRIPYSLVGCSIMEGTFLV